MTARRFEVAVVGATGVIGREILSVLEERAFPIATLRLFASEESIGLRLPFAGDEIRVEALAAESFVGVEIALFCAGVEVSADWAPRATEAGAVVIDASACFRTDPAVPLVVPEVNAPAAADRPYGIVAIPSAVTVPIVVALHPLEQAAGLARVVAATYQAVSGAGQRGMEELSRQTIGLLNMRSSAEEETRPVFPRRIAFNCIPQVDGVRADGSTDAEAALVAETRRILGRDDLAIAATCVRVPTFFGDGVALTLETVRPFPAAEARRLLRQAPGILLCEADDDPPYPTAADVGGTDAVYVGRVRDDPSRPNGLQLWVAADNVRKGAVLTAVQIAELVARGS